MADEWYYTKSGNKTGPVSTQTLKQLAQSGQLLPDDLVWKQGLDKWKEARKIVGLFPDRPPLQAPPPLPPKTTASSPPPPVRIPPPPLKSASPPPPPPVRIAAPPVTPSNPVSPPPIQGPTASPASGSGVSDLFGVPTFSVQPPQRTMAKSKNPRKTATIGGVVGLGFLLCCCGLGAIGQLLGIASGEQVGMGISDDDVAMMLGDQWEKLDASSDELRGANVSDTRIWKRGKILVLTAGLVGDVTGVAIYTGSAAGEDLIRPWGVVQSLMKSQSPDDPEASHEAWNKLYLDLGQKVKESAKGRQKTATGRIDFGSFTFTATLSDTGALWKVWNKKGSFPNTRLPYGGPPGV